MRSSQEELDQIKAAMDSEKKVKDFQTISSTIPFSFWQNMHIGC